ncbi:MAG: ABC transporter ATP-binding protein [Clostridiaceae bacterium]|uniref:ABC transporter ATP-binding protein n=1 Tax=Anaerosalibacter bizertensis TaxID=932217 RepID=A0A9Q4ABB0_9FIRM|nr:ABC transporter ATP-binding protein [Anaerosalibacter bizertensis]MBV1817891.1 ABC transporter ATP-binding protein [Bacteroidales bacterium MSK.15.36]MBW4829655.1 ABC transporter ATP-binding protein [Clostridiaceae bacterium]MBW4859057.1 ABC transporter ATP-binding protein [Clostridiaceae bacterium]MBW4867813.1 ABC transporter ATP-binding protein [Clostridiaceae bacterium]MBW4867996.1 ABC transporter ATP-binding protein [Clostridiaceae bacterium]
MIKLLNINKSFDERVVLSDISLSIKKNEFVCITGESGVGKTTLLNIIGLLDKPDDGEVNLCGETTFSRKDILELRKYFFGYIFQDYLLMQDETVEKNINIAKKYNKQITNKDIDEVIEKVRLDNSYLNRKVCYLSGGEQQKVALARIMLKPYELVLADEPTGNLDYKNKREVIEIFKDIKKSGKTIICVTHDKDVSDSADRIIRLKKL